MKKLLLKSILLLCALITGTSAWATDYVKITSTSELVAGGEYLIVNTAGTYAAGATSTTSTKYATTVGVTVSSNKITDPNANVAVYTLGGNSAGWTFYSSKDSKYLYWTSGNSLNVNATVSNNTKWTVSISDGAATIANVATTDRVIRFNSDRFACYTTNTGTLVSIYKKQTAAVAVTGVSLPSTAKAFIGKTITLTPTFTPSDATNKNVTWESKNTSIATVSSAGVVTGVAEGTVNIEVTTEDGGFNATCSVTVDDGSINLANTGSITFNTFNGEVLGTGGYKTQDCELKASNNNTYTWHETNGYYNNSGWQLKAGGSATSPNIKSANGFTISVTHSTGNNVTISDGTNNGTNSLTTTKTNTKITLQGSGGYTVISGITIIPTPTNPSDPVDNLDGTITLTTTDNMNGWRTFYDASKDYKVDANTKIYIAKKSATAGEVELTALAATKIPAGEAVILKTTDANHEMVLTETTGATTLGANVLAVTDGTNDVDGYRLGYKSGTGIAFYKYAATAPAAGIVYIDKDDVNTGSSAREYLTFSFDEESETTGLNEVKTQKIAGEYFNLAGQRVANPTKGLYIVNGKKVVIK